MSKLALNFFAQQNLLGRAQAYFDAAIAWKIFFLIAEEFVDRELSFSWSISIFNYFVVQNFLVLTFFTKC